MVDPVVAELRRDHKDPQAHAELRRGQTGAALIGQGLAEVGHESTQLGVEIDHWLGRLAQDGVTDEPDGKNSHLTMVRVSA